MRLSTRAIVGGIVAGILVVGTAGVAAAVSPGVPAPRVSTPKTLAHTDAVGPSPQLPALTSTGHTDVAPCRLSDTARHGGKILNGHTRSILVRGTGDLSGQGGASTGCKIPDSASSVDVVVTVTSALAKSGYLTWTPRGSSTALRIVSYTKNQSTSTPATLHVPPSLATADGSLKNIGGSAHVSMVVTGYDSPPIQGLISGAGTIYSGSNRILSAIVGGAGDFTVTFDQDVSYCTPVVHAYYQDYYASATALAGSSVNVRVWSLSGGTVTPVSTYFYLAVIC